MKATSVFELEVLVLPRIATTLAEMVREGIAEPVAVLRRLQAGRGEEPVEIQRYAQMFRTLRGLYGYDNNEQVLEVAIRKAVDLAGSIIV